jgi:Protein of unknown function (DUF3617)
MRNLIVVTAICGVAATALLAQSKITPLKVKTGLWQSTTNIKVSGMPGIPPEMAAKLTPEQRARMEASMSQSAMAQPRTETHKGCLTQEDLTKDPFTPGKNDEGMKCKENLIRSTASDAEVALSCADDRGNSSDFHIAFHAVDQEHVTGTGQGDVNMFGHTMKSDWKFQSHWLQASCPDHTE